MADQSYVLASDSRKVVRLDPRKDELVQVGPIFARDDFEHITRCRKTGRLFAASFDRNIYEINPETLAPKSIVLNSFKMRWIKSLSENCNHMVVQCRNGAIYIKSIVIREYFEFLQEDSGRTMERSANQRRPSDSGW